MENTVQSLTNIDSTDPSWHSSYVSSQATQWWSSTGVMENRSATTFNVLLLHLQCKSDWKEECLEILTQTENSGTPGSDYLWNLLWSLNRIGMTIWECYSYYRPFTWHTSGHLLRHLNKVKSAICTSCRTTSSYLLQAPYRGTERRWWFNQTLQAHKDLTIMMNKASKRKTNYQYFFPALIKICKWHQKYIHHKALWQYCGRWTERLTYVTCVTSSKLPCYGDIFFLDINCLSLNILQCDRLFINSHEFIYSHHVVSNHISEIWIRPDFRRWIYIC